MKILKKLQYHSKKIPLFKAIEGEYFNCNYKELYLTVNNIQKFLLSIPNLKKIIIFGEKKSLAYPIILAALKSKITYVPINSDTPKSRVNKIARLTNSQLIFCVSNNLIKIKGIQTIQIDNFKFLKKKFSIKKKNNKHSNKIAYTIFTSGSTGEPKGVNISYKALEFYCTWLEKKFRVYKKRCSQFSEISFDLSITDIYGTIISGGTICAVESNFYKNFPGRFIYDKKIDYTVIVPSVIDLINKGNNLSGKYFKTLKNIFFCGEPLKKNHLDLIFKAKKNLKILNTYGPTEFTVSCTEILLSNKNYKNYCEKFISIGKPIKGTKFKILKVNKKNNRNNQGLLLLNGKQLFDGYISDKKIENRIIKYKNQKFYNTGDIIKKINKNYYFIKRDDRQIKKNGYRIELDEIDNLIQNKIKLDFCKSFYKYSKIIVVIKSNQKRNFIEEIITRYLPKYMMPNKIIYIKKIPLNKNFKVDNNKIYKSISK